MIATIFFLIGAGVGSFVSVVVDRIHTGLPFLRGRSVCLFCNSALRLFDLIPILSYLGLRGRCRYCGVRIPYQLFVSELIMGGLSSLIYWGLNLGYYIQHAEPSLFVAHFASYALLLVIFAILLGISLYDIRHSIILDKFVVALILASVVFIIFTLGPFALMLNTLSAIVLSAPFFLIHYFSGGRWMGLGDVKLIFAISLWLGLRLGFSALIVAFWSGAIFYCTVIGVKVLIASLKKRPKGITIGMEVPFGPFLAFGAVLSFLFDGIF